MCTEVSPDEFVVCDVAIRDVRAALAEFGSVEIGRVPFEGSLVRNLDATRRTEFRRVLADALAPHRGSFGGSLLG